MRKSRLENRLTKIVIVIIFIIIAILIAELAYLYASYKDAEKRINENAENELRYICLTLENNMQGTSLPNFIREEINSKVEEIKIIKENKYPLNRILKEKNNIYFLYALKDTEEFFLIKLKNNVYLDQFDGISGLYQASIASLLLITITISVLAISIIGYLTYKDFTTGTYNRRYYKYLIMRNKHFINDNPGVFLMVNIEDIYKMMDNEEEKPKEDLRLLVASEIRRLISEKSVIIHFKDNTFLIYIPSKRGDVAELITYITETINERLKKNEDTTDVYIITVAVEYPVDSDNLKSIIRNLNYCIRLVREKGNRDKWMIYNKKIVEHHEEVQEYKNKVMDILENRKIFIVFQPIVKVSNGEILGFEALSRVESEDIGISSLLALTDEMNLSPKLEWIIIRKVFEKIEKNKEILKDKIIFINTSAKVDYTQEEVREFNLIRGNTPIALEITEYFEIEVDKIETKIKKMRGENTLIVLDDFGAGYSNEVALLQVVPDIVKIDIELIRNIDKDFKKQDLVRNLVDYAKKHKIRTVAEGVETRYELDTIKWLQIDYVQGYFFDKPREEIIIREYEI